MRHLYTLDLFERQAITEACAVDASDLEDTRLWHEMLEYLNYGSSILLHS